MQQLRLKANDPIPNNPLPVLVYPPGTKRPSRKNFEEQLKAHGWGGFWVNGVYNYHHYHSNAHEFLGIISGKASLMLGGPGGKKLEVKAGNALVLPAGTGHCLLQATPDFKVLGAYPHGQEQYDLCTAEDKVTEKKKNIARVSLPPADPLGGPLLRLWNKTDA